MEKKQIKRALVSVYHKDKLDVIIKKLFTEGVEFISTGGTKSFIESLDIPCSAVEDLTGYPSILGGRVKTLHPKVFGGILSRRDLEKDNEQIAEYEIPEIDLVIVDLYPFEATVAAGADEPTTIEKIDIGGISLIRAAAKNFKDVVIVASQDQYQPLLEVLEANGAQTTVERGADIPFGRMLDELGWEFAAEAKRRQDLIRFGVFHRKSWFSHKPSATFRNIFPIPANSLLVNPNLKQNPGY